MPSITNQFNVPQSREERDFLTRPETSPNHQEDSFYLTDDVAETIPANPYIDSEVEDQRVTAQHQAIEQAKPTFVERRMSSEAVLELARAIGPRVVHIRSEFVRAQDPDVMRTLRDKAA